MANSLLQQAVAETFTGLDDTGLPQLQKDMVSIAAIVDRLQHEDTRKSDLEGQKAYVSVDSTRFTIVGPGQNFPRTEDARHTRVTYLIDSPRDGEGKYTVHKNHSQEKEGGRSGEMEIVLNGQAKRTLKQIYGEMITDIKMVLPGRYHDGLARALMGDATAAPASAPKPAR